MKPLFQAWQAELIKAWEGNGALEFEDEARLQLFRAARLPFVKPWVAAMPDCHTGIGATIGSVIPTVGAVIPAAVGVDIGCGMSAIRLSARRDNFYDLAGIRKAIEKAVPTGRTNNGGKGDRGAWGDIPEIVDKTWATAFEYQYTELCRKHPGAQSKNTFNQLGTLGTGNHFIELSEDEEGLVWIVLHSGSRGLGNRIGTYFINLAKSLCSTWFINLPDPNLAYFPQGTDEFKDYMDAVWMAQAFASSNRDLMMEAVVKLLGCEVHHEPFVNCHHNYVAWENHGGRNMMITRKGAIRAGKGEMGIIPGSMGAKTYIVRGLGSEHSFNSASHGAGRAMSRTKARATFTVEQHAAATEGVECEKGAGVLDETPGAYKDIDVVMAAQADLVEIVHTLKPFLCVKGLGEERS